MGLCRSLTNHGHVILNWIAVKYFSLDQDLRELSNYLRARGLQHRITEEQGQQCLWVLDEAIIPALQEFLAQYSQGAVNLEIAPAAGVVSYSPPSLLQQAIQVPIVLCLIALSVFGYFLVDGYFGQALFNEFKFTPLKFALSSGEIWRLLTPAFLHFTIFHVLFNCLWLWDLGRRMEYFQGKLHFLIFFVITSVAANLAEFAWSGTINFGGMSGFIYALVGFIAVRQQFDHHPLMQVPRALIGFMLFWLVLCMSGAVDYFIDGSVANAAHLGGLIAGAVYALATKHFYRH